MTLVFWLMMLSCVLFEARGYPVFTSSGNVDTWSYGNADRGGMVLSRFNDPYFNRRAIRSGPTIYALRQPSIESSPDQLGQFYHADRRRQALLEVNDTPPQQNEVLYPQASEGPAIVPIEASEFIEPLEQGDAVPTTKAVTIPELVEPEIEEEKEVLVPEPKKALNKKKQDDEDDNGDEDEFYPRFPKLPSGAFFPMFFGSGSGLGGATAVANAFSNGRGGAAKSDAIAYGIPEIIKKA